MKKSFLRIFSLASFLLHFAVMIKSEELTLEQNAMYNIKITDRQFSFLQNTENNSEPSEIQTEVLYSLDVNFTIDTIKRQLVINCLKALSSYIENGTVINLSEYDKLTYSGERPAFIEKAIIELDREYELNSPELNNNPAYFYLAYFYKVVPLFIPEQNFKEETVVYIEEIPIYCKNNLIKSEDSGEFTIVSEGHYRYKDNRERVLKGKITFSSEAKFNCRKKIINCSYEYIQKKKSFIRELNFSLTLDKQCGEKKQ